MTDSPVSDISSPYQSDEDRPQLCFITHETEYLETGSDDDFDVTLTSQTDDSRHDNEYLLTSSVCRTRSQDVDESITDSSRSDTSSPYQSDEERGQLCFITYETEYLESTSDDSDSNHVSLVPSLQWIQVDTQRMGDESPVLSEPYPEFQSFFVCHGDVPETVDDERHIFPSDVELYLRPCLSSWVNLLADIPGAVVYVKSPMMTILSPEEDITVPNSVICDVFVIRPGMYVTLLTFVSDDPDSSDESYNNHLTTSLKAMLHRDVFVLGKVIACCDVEDDAIYVNIDYINLKNNTFQKILERLEQQALHAGVHEATDVDLATTLQRLLPKERMINEGMFSQFVETAAYQAAKDQLQQGNVLILTGGPGEGKTTIGHRLCYDYYQQGYNTVFYSRQQDINWGVLKLSKLTLLVCDNVTDDDIRDRLQHENDCVKVVVVTAKHTHRLYDEYPIVDVSDIFKRNVDRRREDYFQMLQMLNPRLSESTLNETISKLPTYVGFPKAVKLYRKYKHCVDPVTYFTYPLHYFIGEMENMADTSDMKEWVYLLLCGGNCDDDNDNEFVRTIRQLFPQVFNDRDIKERLRKFTGGYLDAEIIEGRERVLFNHPAIYDACLFVVDRKYPGFLWEHCKVVFERKEEQSHIRLPKLTVFISKHSTNLFLTQIVEDLKQGKFRHSLSHGVLRSQENIDRLFTQLGDRVKDIVKTEEDLGSFFHWAAQSDNQDLMRTALQRTNITQDDVNRALIDCIKMNRSDTFLFLRKELNIIGRHVHYDANCTDTDMNTLLMIAVDRNSLNLVKVIAEDDVNFKMQNKAGNTVLHIACWRWSAQIVDYLLPKIRDFRYLPGPDFSNLVKMAALKGHGQLYEYLADVEKCQLTVVVGNDYSILHLACIGGNLKIVKHLMSSGVIDKNQKGKDLRTPVMMAALKGHGQLYEYLADVEKCQLTGVDGNGDTILHLACVGGNVQIVKSLLSSVVTNKNQTGRDLRTPVMMAALKGNGQLYEYLADVEKCQLTGVDGNGDTILHLACVGGNLQIVKHLVSGGVIDKNKRGQHRKTPLMIAAYCKHREMFDWLVGQNCHISHQEFQIMTELKSHFVCLGGVTEDFDGLSHLFPEDVYLYLEPSISTRVKDLSAIPGAAVYIKSPMMTILSLEDDIPVPQSVICDAFVIKPGSSTMLLTFVWDDPDSSDVSYNSHLVTSRKPTFHRQTQTDVCVFGAVMGEKEWKEEQKFKRKLRYLEQQATHVPTSQVTDTDIITTIHEIVSNEKMTSAYTDMFSQFVETAAYEAAREQLQQGNVLILTGGPGEGKTTIGHRLCYDYHQQGYNTVFYSREQDINWDVLRVAKPTLVVCDNVTDQDFRDKLQHAKGCVKVVIVTEKHNRKLKDKYPTVDVSDIRKQDLDRTKDNYSDMLQTVYTGILDSTQNEIISKLPPYVGFPKAVKLYRKYQHCVDPVSYFTYPLHYFIGEMENMAETSDMKEWVYLLLCGGNCDDDDNDDELLRTIQQLSLQVSNDWDIKERRKQFIGGYAEIIKGGKRVYFSHPAIYDACLFVVDRKYPGFLWKQCKVVFEREEEQILTRLPKLTVFISKHNTELFLTQIVEDLKQWKFRHSLSHGVLRTQKNINRLFTQVGDRLQDIVKAEEESGSFLYWAAQSDIKELVKILLDKQDLTQADVNRALTECIRKNENKPFHLLHKELMIKKGHNSHYHSHLYSLLTIAVKKDNPALVEEIVRDMDDDALMQKNNDGDTALHLVCLTGNTEVVKYMLHRLIGSKDLPGKDLRTPVMMAALKGHGQLYKYLADVEKCQLKGVDDNGDTILHLACVGGNLKIVKHLVSCRIIDKNERGQYGKTPLMIAAYCRHWDMFEWLVGQKCHISPLDFSIKDLVSNWGLNHATSIYGFLQSQELDIMKHSFGCFKYEKSKVLGKHLESKGSNMLFEDESGMSLLHTAANTGHLELTDFLLSKGNVEINIRDGRGRTPIMLAAAGGHGKMFDFLLGKGAVLSMKDESSSGILHFACRGSNSTVIDKIMEHGFTDVNSKNDDMKTPFSYALETGDEQIFNTVLNRGGDLSVVDRDKNTLLHLACKGGNLALVKHLLAMGSFDIDTVNREQRTPLLMAAYSGHTDICDHLICVGADLHKEDRDGNDVLLVAVDQGHFLLAEYILTKCKLTNEDKSGNTAVIKAASKGHSDIFRLFIKTGHCDLYDRDNTYLLHFASVGGSLDIVHYILSHPEAEVNLRDQEGQTPVKLAANNGHQEIFELLVGRGSDLSVVDKHGENILHAAASGGNAAIVQFILSQNIAGIDSTCKNGKTPVMKAAYNGHKQVFDLLVSKEADLSVVDNDKNTILNVACLKDNVEFVKYLLKLNIADINVRGFKGRTPLMQAACNGCRGVFDLLVSNGADLSVVENHKSSSLHVACLNDNVGFVKYLLTLNIADINSRGYKGRTPVMHAVGNGCRGVFDLLKSEGADLTVVDDDKDTILNVACLKDNVEFVRYLLTLNIADINVRGGNGRTPVMQAAGNGCRGVFHLLMSEGADLSVVDDNEDTILHAASSRDNVELVKDIMTLNIADMNGRGQDGRTPVMQAANKGCRGVFDLIMSKEADLSVVDNDKNTILNVACLEDHVEFVKQLLTLNIADINTRGYKGRTPVMQAAGNGCRGVFDLLVSNGADLSVMDDNKDTILNVACLKDNVDFVKYLLTLNIGDINVRGEFGKTPVMQAAGNGCRGVFDLLMSKGADLSVLDNHKSTLLHVACLKDNVAFVKYLLTLNIADINVRGQYGRTPVMEAAGNGCRGVFDLLVSKGADLSIVDDDKDTVLIVACLKDNVEFVKHLLTLTIAIINVKGEDGWTPVMDAARYGCRGVFDLLVNKGADLSNIGNNNYNILHLACIGGNVEIVKYLLSLDTLDINSKTKDGLTPAMVAREHDKMEVFDLLVEKGSQVK